MAYKILIIGSNSETQGIQNRKSGRLFLEGMKRHNVNWNILYPTKENITTQIIPALHHYDAIVFWSYIVYHIPEYLSLSKQIEIQAQKLNIPIVNNVLNTDAPHSYFLDIWKRNGINCARSQSFQNFEDIDLHYPLLIRRDGVHKGQDVVLVQHAQEARHLIEERQRDNAQPNFNVAIEYVETAGKDGLYRKYRSLVIGNQIIPRHLFVSKHWLVNFTNGIFNAASRQEIWDFIHKDLPNHQALLNAAKTAGQDIMALDYSIDQQGNPIFWEANLHFLMAGDVSPDEVERFLKFTGLSAAEVKRLDMRIADAYYHLVQDKIQNNT